MPTLRYPNHFKTPPPRRLLRSAAMQRNRCLTKIIEANVGVKRHNFRSQHRQPTLLQSIRTLGVATGIGDLLLQPY